MKLLRHLPILMLSLTVHASVLPFDSAAPVTATASPAANTLNVFSNTCETSNSGLLINTTILTNAACNSAVFTFNAFTVANFGIHAGNVAASASSQAHAYIMSADGSAFTLNGLSVKSYASAIDQKVNQWIIVGEKADGTVISYQYPNATTSFAFIDMVDIKYAEVYSFRGAFDLYNLDVTQSIATPIPTAVPTPLPTATPTPKPTASPMPRHHR